MFWEDKFDISKIEILKLFHPYILYNYALVPNSSEKGVIAEQSLFSLKQIFGLYENSSYLSKILERWFKDSKNDESFGLLNFVTLVMGDHVVYLIWE